MTKAIVSEARIVNAIMLVRGQRVILAPDLARLYGVTTSHLNQQVKRNHNRFPNEFCFSLTRTERDEVITNCDHLESLRFSAALPLAFTEHRVIMAANVLNSPQAVDASVKIVRAFISMRDTLLATRELARKVDALERRFDGQFKVVFEALRELMTPAARKKPPIGFR